MAITHVTDADFAQVVEQSATPVLVDFWAEWCGPCRAMNPILDEFSTQHGARVQVAKLNIDENPATAQRFRVMSIPTMLLFEGGTVQKQIVGALSKQRLEEALGEWVSTPA